jgi:hypothetical protein
MTALRAAWLWIVDCVEVVGLICIGLILGLVWRGEWDE